MLNLESNKIRTMLRYFGIRVLVIAMALTSCSMEGAEGPMGPAASDGIEGVAGPAGPQGNPGPVGEDGEAQGVPGPQGDEGAQGSEGPKGDTGADGATGPQGPKGDSGAQGPNGDTGAQGATGPKGVQGNANASTYSLPISSKLGSIFNVNFDALTKEVLEDYAILSYVERGNAHYPVPGISYSDQMEVEYFVGNLNVYFYKRSDGSAKDIAAGNYKAIKCVIIESTGTDKSSKNNPLMELKLAGIDIN